MLVYTHFDYFIQHCKVPLHDESGLGVWGKTQRQSKQKNDLSKEKVDLLNQIDFEWSKPGKERWLERYQELKQFREKHGVSLSLIVLLFVFY